MSPLIFCFFKLCAFLDVPIGNRTRHKQHNKKINKMKPTAFRVF